MCVLIIQLSKWNMHRVWEMFWKEIHHTAKWNLISAKTSVLTWCGNWITTQDLEFSPIRKMNILTTLHILPKIIFPKHGETGSEEDSTFCPTWPTILRRCTLRRMWCTKLQAWCSPGCRFFPEELPVKDCKFSLLKKEQQWVLSCNDQIAWLIGERTDNRFRIDDSTQKVIIAKLGKQE